MAEPLVLLLAAGVAIWVGGAVAQLTLKFPPSFWRLKRQLAAFHELGLTPESSVGLFALPAHAGSCDGLDIELVPGIPAEVRITLRTWPSASLGLEPLDDATGERFSFGDAFLDSVLKGRSAYDGADQQLLRHVHATEELSRFLSTWHERLERFEIHDGQLVCSPRRQARWRASALDPEQVRAMLPALIALADALDAAWSSPLPEPVSEGAPYRRREKKAGDDEAPPEEELFLEPLVRRTNASLRYEGGCLRGRGTLQGRDVDFYFVLSRGSLVLGVSSPVELPDFLLHLGASGVSLAKFCVGRGRSVLSKLPPGGEERLFDYIRNNEVAAFNVNALWITAMLSRTPSRAGGQALPALLEELVALTVMLEETAG